MILLTTLLLAIIVVMILELIRKEKSNTEQTLDSVCSSCGRRLKSNFVYCPYCSFPQKKICSNCQSVIKPFWKACPYCGERVNNQGVNNEKQ